MSCPRCEKEPINPCINCTKPQPQSCGNCYDFQDYMVNPLVNKAPLCTFCGAKTTYFNETEDISEEITEDIEE